MYKLVKIKLGVATVASDKIYFKVKIVIRDKDIT